MTGDVFNKIMNQEKTKKLITNKLTNYQAGFTLFFAIVVIAVLMGVGVAIANLVTKQLKLSSLYRESQVAFYNADTGLECALRWLQGSEELGITKNVAPSGIICSNLAVTFVPSDLAAAYNIDSCDLGSSTSVVKTFTYTVSTEIKGSIS